MTSEKNTLEENNEFLQEQIKELNQEICELKLNQEIYDQLEDKLEEYQRQFENLISNSNNPSMQNSQFQQLINENVELNNIKNKFNELEKEIDGKNKEIDMLKEKLIQMETNIGDIINQNVNDNMLAANNHIKEIEEHLYHADQRIKFLDEENAYLKKNIEDNKLIIFSLREKCKDMIAKEKEVFQLQATIEELKQKKNKRVTFGKDIVVEFKKEKPYIEENNNYNNNNYQSQYQNQNQNQNQYQNQYYNQNQYQGQQSQPYYQGQIQNQNQQYQQGGGYYQNTNNINVNMNQRNNNGYRNNINNIDTNFAEQGQGYIISNKLEPYNNNNSNDNNQVDAYGNKKISTVMDNNLQELLKSQQSLYEKYSNQLNNIKKVPTPSIFDDIDKLINPTNNTNLSTNNDNTNNQIIEKKENIDSINNEDTIITQKIQMNLTMENNSMILPKSKKQAENIGLNIDKTRNSLTNSVNEIAEKYNLSGYTEKSSSQILNDFSTQKKTSSEAKNSMDIFDKILQENAIDLNDIDKNQNSNTSKENLLNTSNEKNEEENFIDEENNVDSIIMEIDVTSKTQSPNGKKKEKGEYKAEDEEIHNHENQNNNESESENGKEDQDQDN